MFRRRLPIVQSCVILRVLDVVCACLVGGSILDSVALYCECYRLCVHVYREAPYWTALLYIATARGCVCMSNGRLSIGLRCFTLRVLEVVCAFKVGGSLLDCVALYWEC